MRLQVAETPIAQVVDSLAGGTGRGISFLAASSEELLSNALLSLLVILILVLARRVLIRAMDRWVGDPVARYRWTKSSAYLTSALAVGAILLIWFEAVRPLGTFLGLLAAGLAIALRDPVANFAGWAFILWRRPFDVGVNRPGIVGDPNP